MGFYIFLSKASSYSSSVWAVGNIWSFHILLGKPCVLNETWSNIHYAYLHWLLCHPGKTFLKKSKSKKSCWKQLTVLGAVPAKSALNLCIQLPQNLISPAAHCIWLTLLHPRTAEPFVVDKKKDISKVTSSPSKSSSPRKGVSFLKLTVCCSDR